MVGEVHPTVWVLLTVSSVVELAMEPNEGCLLAKSKGCIVMSVVNHQHGDDMGVAHRRRQAGLAKQRLFLTSSNSPQSDMLIRSPDHRIAWA